MLLLDPTGRFAEAYTDREGLDFSLLLRMLKQRSFTESAASQKKQVFCAEKPFHLEDSPEKPEQKHEQKREKKPSVNWKRMGCFLAMQLGLVCLFSALLDRITPAGLAKPIYLGIAVTLVALDLAFLKSCVFSLRENNGDKSGSGSEEKRKVLLEKMLVREKGVLKEGMNKRMG